MKLQIVCDDPEIRKMYEFKKCNLYNGDCGFDIYCPENVELRQGESTMLNLGIKCYSVDNKGYMLVPRSSFVKLGLVLLNSIGIIDPGYTGEIKAKVHRLYSYFDFTQQAFKVLMWYFTTIVFYNTCIMNDYSKSSFSVELYLMFYSVYYYYTNKLDTLLIWRGQSLFQLVAFDGERIEVEFVDNLPETDRGDKGFGSTNLDFEFPEGVTINEKKIT